MSKKYHMLNLHASIFNAVIFFFLEDKNNWILNTFRTNITFIKEPLDYKHTLNFRDLTKYYNIHLLSLEYKINYVFRFAKQINQES